MINLKYIWNLTLLSSLSFGSHFATSSLSIFGVFLIEDKIISAEGLGFLFAANYASSIFLPLLIGYLIDSTKKVKSIALSLLFVTTVGQALLVFALYKNIFVMAILAQALFGSGAASVSAIQRISIAYYLKGNEAITTSVYVTFGSIAKLLGKIIVGPVAMKVHSYQKTLLLPVIMCAFSLSCYIAFIATNPKNDRGYKAPQQSDVEMTSDDTAGLGADTYQYNTTDDYVRLSTQEVREHEEMARCDCNVAKEQHARDEEMNTFSLSRLSGLTFLSSQPEAQNESALRVAIGPPAAVDTDLSVVDLLRTLSSRYYCFAVIHAVYIVVFHILWNFIPHIVTVEYGFGIIDAGYIAGFPQLMTIFLAPVIGIIVNQCGHSVLVGCIAQGLATLGYVILVFTKMSPVVPIVMLSLAQATLPTILLMNITLSLSAESTGIAFGIVEVLDSVANLLGNCLFGYLFDLTGSYDTGMLMLLAFAMLALVMLMYIQYRDLNVDNDRVDDRGTLYGMTPESSSTNDRMTIVGSNSALLHHSSQKSYDSV